MKRLKQHLPFFAALIAPAVLYHWRIVFLGEIICGGDMIGQFVPWREFALRELLQGRFPVWNPFVFCGTPFAANIQTSLFYPWNLLNLLCSVERTFSLSLVFHHILSLITMYAFLVRLWGSRGGAVIGAIAYGWSGFFLTHGHDGHLIHIRAYALIPLAFYFQLGFRSGRPWRTILLFALSLTGMFYAGHTQIPLYVFYLLLSHAVWRAVHEFRITKNRLELIRYPGWTLTGLAIAVGLAAFVLVPLIELSGETASRAGGANYEFATSDSMPPQHTITLIAPFFFGDPSSELREEQFWETRTGYHEISGYIGLLPFLLVLFAFLPSRKSEDLSLTRFFQSESLFFLLVAGAGLLFALGSYTPFYKILYYGFPGWSYFRVPGRLLLLSIIGFSVLSARGYQRLRQTGFSQAIDSRAGKFAAIGSILFLLGTIILMGSKPAVLHWLREFEISRTISEFALWNVKRTAISQQLPELLFESRYAVMLKSCLTACGLIVGGWLCLYLSSRIKNQYAWLIPAILLSADVFFFAVRFTQTLPAQEWKETYFPQSELIQFLQDHNQGDRVLCLDDAIGYPVLNHHPELRPNRLMYYGIRTVRGYDPIILRSYTRYINRMFGKEPDTPQGGLLFFPSIPPQEALNTMNVRLILTSQSLPAPYKSLWKDTESGLNVYENPGCKPFIHVAQSSHNTDVQIQTITPASIAFHTGAEMPSRIVLSQNHYRGWKVHADDASLDLARYNGALQSFDVPAGQHQIQVEMNLLSLQSLSSYTIGGLITLATGFLCFLLLFRFKDE